MIHISEIERVIAEIEKSKVLKLRDSWDHGWNSAISMTIHRIRGLIPSEPEHSGISGDDKETKQDEKRQNES